MEKKVTTLRQLMLLLIVFLVGIVSLILLHLFFLNLIDELDKKTTNLKAKIQIGEHIVNDLYKVRSDFYEMSTVANNTRSMLLIKQRLLNRIDTINEALDILEKGGVLKRVIRLNIAGHHNTTSTITYKKSSTQLSLEVIDIRPKLIQLQTMIDSVLSMLKKRNQYLRDNDTKRLTKANKRIARFYKTTPAYFVRMTENVSRLLYEGNNELLLLKDEIKVQKNYYETLELLLIISIIFIVMILGSIIAKQINVNSIRLEVLNKQLAKKMEELNFQQVSTRGILDAQPNIVLVTNGERMIDANNTLIEFFDDYESFDDFFEKHKCICDFFEPSTENGYISSRVVDGENWAFYILNHPNQKFKVILKRRNFYHHFIINVQKKELDKDNFILVVTLNDITNEIENQEKLRLLNENLEDMVSEKTKELQELNENLEQKILIEVEKNRQKDKQMIQQSRFAALGEMIGNIAHQWRQPLSAISSTASSMQLQMQLKLASEEEIDKSYSDINKYVNFLSQTIEDFRGFFREDKEKAKFDMNSVLKTSLSITQASYRDNSIFVDDTKIYSSKLFSNGFPNELSQVFLNILNNAKDALKDKEIDKKYVIVQSFKDEEYNTIIIKDNAGGVPDDIIDKIFDPYFTTKHKSQGTGIGLYMSKDIVEKHMDGIINVSNETYTYNGKSYKGAQFTIKLPKV